MAGVKVVLDGSSAAWMDVFKNSPEIRAGLEAVVSAAAAKNTAMLQSSDVKGLKPDHRFEPVIDIADKTMLGKVVAVSGAKGVAIEAGLPRW